TWVMAQGPAERALAAIEESRSGLVLPPGEEERRRGVALGKAADAAVTRDLAERLARRLGRSAIYLDARGDARLAGAARASAAAERVEDDVALELVDQVLVARRAGRRARHPRRRSREAGVVGEQLGADLVALAEDDRPLQHVLELAHVPRPAMALEQRHRLGG